MRKLEKKAESGLNQDESYDLDQKTKKLAKIRMLFSDERESSYEDGWEGDFLEHQRRRFSTTASPEPLGAENEEKEHKRKTTWLFFSCFQHHKLNEDIAHPLGVHYRSSRGTQMSSNWLGLIV